MSHEISPLINEKQLKQWLGFSHRAALMRWLEKENIRYWTGNRGLIVTTLSKIEESRITDLEKLSAIPRFANDK